IDLLDCLRAELGGEVDQVIGRDALLIECGRLRRNRLRRRIPLARRVSRQNGTLDNRPDRTPRDAVEDVRERLLGYLCDGLDSPAVDGDIDQDRSRSEVVVPEPMMDGLKVPDALSGLR